MTEPSSCPSRVPLRIARVVAAPALIASTGSEPAEAASVGIVPEGATSPIAWGDCIALPDGGGERPFSMAAGIRAIERIVAPALQGRAPSHFREAAAWVDALRERVEEGRPLPVADLSRRALLTAPLRAILGGQNDALGLSEQVAVERPLHPAVRFGVGQALLQAIAWRRGLTMAEVIAEEWGLAPRSDVVLHARPRPDRQTDYEEMIAWRLRCLTLTRIDNIPTQLGYDGLRLTQEIRGLRDRIRTLAGEIYEPWIRLDLHGALGAISGNDAGKMLGHLYGWEAAARPYPLRIEDPLILDNLRDQIAAMRTMHDYVRARQMRVQLVAGAWAVTLDGIRAFAGAGAADMVRISLPTLGALHSAVEAVLVCRAVGVDALLDGGEGGTCHSARVAVHLAIGCGVDLLLAGSGSSVDDAVGQAHNEMARTFAEIALHRERALSR